MRLFLKLILEKHLNEACENNEDCRSITEAVCDDKLKKCKCPEKFPVPHELKACLKGKLNTLKQVDFFRLEIYELEILGSRLQNIDGDFYSYYTLLK